MSAEDEADVILKPAGWEANQVDERTGRHGEVGTVRDPRDVGLARVAEQAIRGNQ